MQAPAAWQMTVYADSITAAQRIKLDRKPEDGNMEDAYCEEGGTSSHQKKT